MPNRFYRALDALGRRRQEGERLDPSLSMDAYANMLSSFNFGGMNYPILNVQQTMPGNREEIGAGFGGIVQGAYRGNGVVFACILARMMLFSEARFQFQRMKNGIPGELFGTSELDILDTPWSGATTGDLLARAEQDASLFGNFFGVRRGNEIHRLRPDWVTIVAGSASDPDVTLADINARLVGYIYHPHGPAANKEPVNLRPEEVCHYAPIPDPLYSFRGMSWLQPILREIMADGAATSHKLNFFENAATPNMVVTLGANRVTGDPMMSKDSFDKWVEAFEKGHRGLMNAYKTLYLAGGANVTSVGSNFQQMDFKVTQGAGEPLALDTPIPTPSGWTTMGEIQVGEQVFGRDGLSADVLDVLPVHEGRACYRVTFSDRTSIVADGSHLWTAMDRNTARREERLYTTEQLRDLIAEWKARGIMQAHRIGIPAADPVELPARNLLVDPYILGAWLGDGQTAGAAICGAEPDLAFIAGQAEQRGYTVTRWAVKPPKVPVIGLPGGLLAALDALGVLGDKHIPATYLRASRAQRLDLLRGLMDTDGTIGHIGAESCEFSSKWERLARQVAELARTLGYRATVSRKEEPRSRTGATWRVSFRADPDVNPFLLPRKAARSRTPVHVKNRTIVSIEPVDSVPVRCIAVNTPDHLFRAGEGWTLTHNTRIAAAANVPPIIVGLSEGLAAGTYNNYGQACRRFADLFARPAWRNMAGSLQRIINCPGGADLSYDDRRIAFLKADLSDEAKVRQTNAATISSLISAGFKPDDVVTAVVGGDLLTLKGSHTGLTSVQLQPPATPGEPGSLDDPTTDTQPATPDANTPTNGKGKSAAGVSKGAKS